MSAHDFQVSDHGSIVLFIPQNAAARAWIRDHLPADAPTFAGGVAVEARYIGDIVDGATCSGFDVEWRI